MKILEISDFHIDPKWIDESETDLNKVCQIAKENNVDAICSSGDYFNKAVMATDQNKWDRILAMSELLQSIAPVYFIQGTKSHDPDGIYKALEYVGFKEVTAGKSHKVGNVLISGLPEITPSFIIADNPELSKAEAIEKQYDLVDQIFDNYYLPMIEAHNGPVHFMMHGVISGAKFREDQKPRVSEFVYSEHILSRLNADRIQAGHIHMWQKFDSINAEYISSPHMTWNDLGYIPGFNIVEYSDKFESVTRYDFDKPERQKITIESLKNLPDWTRSEVQAKYAATDLWIEVKCDKAFADQFDVAASLQEIRDKIHIGPLSKITLDIQHEEHTRIDLDEYESCKSTEDLYRIYDPEVSDSTLLKVREAEEATGQTDNHVNRVDIDFEYLYLKGSKAGLENGVEEIEVDFNQFKTGANLITGPNGTGKSFMLGFCTPYSQHIPTGSDFKSLFDLKDSQIIRRFRVDGRQVTQKILIDPTLASPTAKYYMDIDGKAVENVTGNKAPFDTAVLDMFGSLKMFMACVFKGQKESKEFPSLENAKESDLRQIFTELSGIDRTPMKEYAHNKAVTLKKDIELDSREVDTLSGMIEDDDNIESQIAASEGFVKKHESELRDLSDSIQSTKTALESIERVKMSNDTITVQIAQQEQQSVNLTGKIVSLTDEINRVSATLGNMDQYRAGLAELNQKRTDYLDLSDKYLSMQNDFNKSLDEYNTADAENRRKLEEITERANKMKSVITERQGAINRLEDSNINYRQLKDRENQPCEHCGKLSSTAIQKITEYAEIMSNNDRMIEEAQAKIEEMQEAVKLERQNYKAVQDSAPVKPEATDELNTLKYRYDTEKPDMARISELENIIGESDERKKSIESAQAEIVSLEKQRDCLNDSILKLRGELKEYDIHEYRRLENVHSETVNKIDSLKTDIANLKAEIKTLNQKLEENRSRRLKVDEIKERISSVQTDVTEWQDIEDAFNAKGIPALELSLIAPLIDREANRLLKTNGTRFRTEIITQDLDSTGKRILEKFKILVHDSHASEVKNLPCLSPGQLGWVSTAVTDAIAIEAQKRTGRAWKYAIKDEPDAALDVEAITSFYSMLDLAMDGERKLIAVSHSPTAHELVGNTYQVTDFLRGYKE